MVKFEKLKYMKSGSEICSLFLLFLLRPALPKAEKEKLTAPKLLPLN